VLTRLRNDALKLNLLLSTINKQVVALFMNTDATLWFYTVLTTSYVHTLYNPKQLH